MFAKLENKTTIQHPIYGQLIQRYTIYYYIHFTVYSIYMLNIRRHFLPFRLPQPTHDSSTSSFQQFHCLYWTEGCRMSHLSLY